MGPNYPPGVTGNEYAIAGPDYEAEMPGPCPQCGREELLTVGFQGTRWVACGACEYASDIQYPGEDEEPPEPEDWGDDGYGEIYEEPPHYYTSTD